MSCRRCGAIDLFAAEPDRLPEHVVVPVDPRPAGVDPHQLGGRPAADPAQQHRRGGRDPGHDRLRAGAADLRQPSADLGHLRHVVHRESLARWVLPVRLPGGDVPRPVRGLRLRHRRHVRRGDRRRRQAGAARHPRRHLALRHRRLPLPPWRDPLVQGHRGGRGRGPGVRLSVRHDDQGEPDGVARWDHPRRPVPVRHPDRRLGLHPGHSRRDDAPHVLHGSRRAAAIRRARGAM